MTPQPAASVALAPAAWPAPGGATLDDRGERLPTPASIGRTLGLLRPARRGLAGAALLGTAAAGCAGALLATSAWLITRAAQHPPVLTLMVAIVAVRAFGLGRGVLRYLERLCSHSAAFTALTAARVRVYERLERLTPAGLPSWRRGELLSGVVEDADALTDVAVRGLLPIVSGVLLGGSAVTLASALFLPAGVVLAVALLVAAVVAPGLGARAERRSERQVAALHAHRTALVVDYLDALPDLVAAGAVETRLQEVAATERALARHGAAAARRAGMGVGLASAALGIAILAGLLLVGPAVHRGQVSGPVLAVLALLPLALGEVVQALPAAVQQLARGRAAAGRLLAVLDASDPVAEPVVAEPLPAGAASQPHLRVQGLTAAWPGQRCPALADVDLDLPFGHRVAVVGASGAGKSTLLAVLQRFLDPSAGRVMLDGVDTRRLDGDAVRALSALCDQRAHLFDSTVAENIRLARPGASESELLDALRGARLVDWVTALPDALDTRVGEHGRLVSGGQRQRLALARALLACRPVLLLDEPTAGLDEPTAAALTRDLIRAGAGRTVVLVTHRLADLHTLDLDEIIVLDAGRVVQRGGPAEVVADPDAPYQRLRRATAADPPNARPALDHPLRQEQPRT